MKRLALLCFLLLAACAPSAEETPPTATTVAPTPAGLPTMVTTVPPAATEAAATEATAGAPAPTTAASAATASPSDEPAMPAATAAPSGPIAGRNDDGTFFYGAAGAPLTLIDYSDFL